MAHHTKNGEDRWSGPPYIVYRNPKDDVIRLAFEEAAKRLTAQGNPLFHPKKGWSGSRTYALRVVAFSPGPAVR